MPPDAAPPPDESHGPADPPQDADAPGRHPPPWLVWGGTALATAALTLGTALAARRLAGLLSAEDRPRPRKAPTRRPDRSRRLGLMQEIEENAASLSRGVEDGMRALTTALAGFRAVAGEASSIGRAFGEAADLLRQVMGRRPTTAARAGPGDAPLPDLRRDPLLHDPWEGPEPREPADHDPRLHRL